MGSGLRLDQTDLEELIEKIRSSHYLEEDGVNATRSLRDFVLGGRQFKADEKTFIYHCTDYTIEKHGDLKRQAPFYDHKKEKWVYPHYAIHPLEVSASMYNSDYITKIAGQWHDLVEEVVDEKIKKARKGLKRIVLRKKDYDEIYLETFLEMKKSLQRICRLIDPENWQKYNKVIESILNTVNKLTRRAYQDYYADVSGIFGKENPDPNKVFPRPEFNDVDILRAANVKMKDRENNITRMGWEIREAYPKWRWWLREALKTEPVFHGEKIHEISIDTKVDTLNYDHELSNSDKVKIYWKFLGNKTAHLLRYRKGFRGAKRLQELYKNLVLINRVRKKILQINKEIQESSGKRYGHAKDLIENMKLYFDDLVEASLEEAIKYRNHIKRYHISPRRAYYLEDENVHFKKEGGYKAITAQRKGSRYHGVAERLFDPIITEKKTRYLNKRKNQYLGAIALVEIFTLFKDNPNYTLQGMTAEGLEAIDSDKFPRKEPKKKDFKFAYFLKNGNNRINKRREVNGKIT